MNYEFPASVEREVERYAEEAKLSPDKAVVQLIQSGQEEARRSATPGELSEKEWRKLRSDPLFEFLASLPDSTIDAIESGSRQIRSEGIRPRG